MTPDGGPAKHRLKKTGGPKGPRLEFVRLVSATRSMIIAFRPPLRHR